MSVLERCPSCRESSKWSKERQGPTPRVRFTEVSVKKESTVLSITRLYSQRNFMMNSTNWPPPNVWVLIAQLVEHCSANAEAMGSNPVEVPKFFSG